MYEMTMDDMSEICMRPPPPYRLTTSRVIKLGDLIQFTKFNGSNDKFVYIYGIKYMFTDFYCKVIGIHPIQCEVLIEVYHTITNKSLIEPINSEWVELKRTGYATLNLRYMGDTFFKPYHKLDLSKINFDNVDLDALIPEDLYK